jgi:hypothetical protein
MYYDVYDTFVKANVAIKLDNLQWSDRDNNISLAEEEASGRKTGIKVTIQDIIIITDEGGGGGNT